MIMYNQLVLVLVAMSLIGYSILEMMMFAKEVGIKSIAHLKLYILKGLLPGEVSNQIGELSTQIATAIAVQNPTWSRRRVSRKAKKVVSEVIYNSLKS